MSWTFVDSYARPFFSAVFSAEARYVDLKYIRILCPSSGPNWHPSHGTSLQTVFSGDRVAVSFCRGSTKAIIERFRSEDLKDVIGTILQPKIWNEFMVSEIDPDGRGGLLKVREVGGAKFIDGFLLL